MNLPLYRIALLGVAAFGLSALEGNAQIVPVFNSVTSSGHATLDYKFTGLSSDNHPTYPNFGNGTFDGKGSWPSAIHADGSALETLNRPDTTQTSDFLAEAGNGGGVYSFFSETTYTIAQSTPVASLSSLTLQFYQAAGSDAGVNVNNQEYVGSPSLTLTFADSTQLVISAAAGVVSNVTSAVIFGQSTTLNDTSFLFDLSTVTKPIASYSLSFTTATHSILYGADVTEVSAVPEPSTWAMLVAGVTCLFFCGRLRRSREA